MYGKILRTRLLVLWATPPEPSLELGEYKTNTVAPYAILLHLGYAVTLIHVPEEYPRVINANDLSENNQLLVEFHEYLEECKNRGSVTSAQKEAVADWKIRHPWTRWKKERKSKMDEDGSVNSQDVPGLLIEDSEMILKLKK